MKRVASVLVLLVRGAGGWRGTVVQPYRYRYRYRRTGPGQRSAVSSLRLRTGVGLRERAFAFELRISPVRSIRFVRSLARVPLARRVARLFSQSRIANYTVDCKDIRDSSNVRN